MHTMKFENKKQLYSKKRVFSTLLLLQRYCLWTEIEADKN